MRSSTGFGFLAAAALAVTLAGCSGTGIPEEPGVYAVNHEGELQRLDGSAEWERETWPDRQNFPQGTHFLVRYPADRESGANRARTISLKKVGWVRSEIRGGHDIGPPQGRRWVTAAVPTLEVPLRVMNDQPDVLMFGPQNGTLPPGLYSLQLNSAGHIKKARFGVGWSDIDKTRYAGANCIDRYIEEGGASYRPCATQRVETAADGLQVRLADPDRQIVGGRVHLVVKGTIANLSGQPQTIPTLHGQLKDDSGRVVHQWEFAGPASQLEPGSQVPFTTVADNVPPSASDLTVSFQPYTRASLP